MRPFTRYIGQNNKQNTVFPLEYMYLTQGEGGSTSHQGTYAMDFQGMSSPTTRQYHCPYYSPCNLRLVSRPDDQNHVYVYTSTSEVNFIDGTTGYLTIMVNHDNDIYNIGRTVSQGQLLGKTGTFGSGSATGVADHVHIEVKKGQWEGLIQNSQGVWCMKNADHIYNLIGVNDTTLIVTGGYNWREFPDSPIPPSNYKKSHFPWALYSRKLRQKNVK